NASVESPAFGFPRANQFVYFRRRARSLRVNRPSARKPRGKEDSARQPRMGARDRSGLDTAAHGHETPAVARDSATPVSLLLPHGQKARRIEELVRASHHGASAAHA